MIKVGVIGCGKIAERASLPNLVNYKDKCRVTCLCDIEEAKVSPEGDSDCGTWRTRHLGGGMNC